MKKFIALLSVIAVIVSFAACGEKKKEESKLYGDPEKVTGVEYINKAGDQLGEKSIIGEDDVTVFIPSEYIMSMVQSIVDTVKSKGAYEVKVYSDSAILFKMKRADYDAFMLENKANFEKNISDMKSRYTRLFTDIKYNEDFTHFDFYANAVEYAEVGDTMAQENLFAGSRMFQLYMGKDPSGIKMSFNVYDTITGEIIESSIYPDDIKH